MKKRPTKDQVKKWLETGDWGGDGIDPLIQNACRVAQAYIEILEELERITEGSRNE